VNPRVLSLPAGNEAPARERRSHSRPFDVILFDLGGVLIRYDGIRKMFEWTGGKWPREELWRLWLESPAVRRFEVGASAPERFAFELIEEFGLPVSPAEFIPEFASWMKGFYPGARELVKHLKTSFRLALLSNINHVFWEKVSREDDFFEYFSEVFPSHRIGIMKPDRESFEFAIRKLGCLPERILFFDDNAINVNAAAKTGMRALQSRGVRGVIEALDGLGIEIDPSVRARAVSRDPWIPG
jgi:putative hydrolase of the HAD superfamily